MYPTTESYALLYHAHHEAHLEDVPFWLELAHQAGDAVLELGCGTGRVLSRLVMGGFTAFGLDHDLIMLRTLRRFWPVHPGNLPGIFQADFTAFSLGRAFGFICLPCNTLNTLPETKRPALYWQIRRHLKPGGCFSASMPNPVLLSSLPRKGDPELEDVFYHPLDHEPVQVSSSWQRDASMLTLSWHYDHLQPNGVVNRTTISTHHHFISLTELGREIDASGMEVQTIYGDFDFSPFTENSPYLILVARRS